MKSIEEMMKAAQEAAATVQAQMQEAQAKLDNVCLLYTSRCV